MAMILPRWVLPASLTLNAFLAALLATRLLVSPLPPPPPHGHIIDDIARHLPAGDASILRRTMAAKAGAIDSDLKTMDDMSQRLDAILRQEPFDRTAFLATMAARREARENFEKAMDEALPDALERLSPAGRHHFANLIGHAPPP
jgi:hypothetical protein